MDGIYNINKPQWKTSQQVLNILKGVFKKKKLGHLGTLDPFATGVLPVFVGEATKLIPYLNDEKKKYQASLVLGRQTDTLDLSGETLEEKPVPFFDESQILKVFSSFLGKQNQVPPQYSAIKIKGKPAYRYARAGVEIELQSREVNIYDLKLLSFTSQKIIFECEVSRGTYVRSLALNIAQALGSIGYLENLIRLKSGLFLIKESLVLEEIEKMKPEEILSQAYPLSKLFPHILTIDVSNEELELLLKGQWIPFEKLDSNSALYFIRSQQKIMALGEFNLLHDQSYLKIKRVLRLS